MSYLLDSSAWLAHLFGEPGVEDVNLLFSDPHDDVSISALSLPEVYGRLKSLGRQDQWPAVWELYAPLFTEIIPVDEAIAHRAILLRATAASRLPTVDSLIAATAQVRHLTLVHRDPRMAAIQDPDLRQQQLPAE